MKFNSNSQPYYVVLDTDGNLMSGPFVYEENVQGFVDRAIDLKLIEKMKTVVKLNEKTVSLDEFNKMMAE